MDMITIRHWLGERVLIREPDIKAVVCQIIFEGSMKEAIHCYRLRYWINGEMHEANFDEDEIDYIGTAQHKHIGFSKGDNQ